MTDETPTTNAEESSPEAPAVAPRPAAAPAKRKRSRKSAAPRVRRPDEVEFRFKGEPDAPMRGVPAADLTQADVDRLVYRRTIPAPGVSGLRRGEAGFSEAWAKTVRELVATGHFTRRS